MDRDVIIALDFSSRDEAARFLAPFADAEQKPYVKVGMELFYAAGADFMRDLKAKGYKVFLDLKLHDIPNTVAGAVASLAALSADMLTLHASGGREMIRRAREAADAWDRAPILLGVTVLTSFDDASRSEVLLGEGHTAEEAVLALADVALDAGCGGIVSSAMEGKVLREKLGTDFPLVCPGIRPAGTEVGDQKRVVTPADARDLGVDYIVVGRPITRAEDPLAAYRAICEEFLGGNR